MIRFGEIARCISVVKVIKKNVKLAGNIPCYAGFGIQRGVICGDLSDISDMAGVLNSEQMVSGSTILSVSQYNDLHYGKDGGYRK